MKPITSRHEAIKHIAKELRATFSQAEMVYDYSDCPPWNAVTFKLYDFKADPFVRSMTQGGAV